MPTTRSRWTTPEDARRGLTLLELMLVMAILSVLFGIGIGAVRNLAAPDRIAASAIRDALTRARLDARRSGLPSTVAVDPAAGTVVPLALRLAGNWHFEDDAGTGWPVDALYDEGARTADGAIGGGLLLDGASALVVPLMEASPNGFGIDLALDPGDAPRPVTLLEREGCWSIGLDGDDRLVVRLELADGRQLVIERDAPVLRPWPRRLSVVYDGWQVAVAVDGEALGEDAHFERAQLLAPAHGVPLRTGKGLIGRLDELRVYSVEVRSAQALPQDVTLLGPATRLRFDGRGRLPGGAAVSFAHGEPPRRITLEISPLGAVRTRVEGRP